MFSRSAALTPPHDGYRFSNAAGAHEAIVDYAFAIKLVDRTHYAQLDQLRDLRHQVNYPEDLIAPSPREIDQYSELVDAILVVQGKKLPTRRVPPPPGVTAQLAKLAVFGAITSIRRSVMPRSVS